MAQRSNRRRNKEKIQTMCGQAKKLHNNIIEVFSTYDERFPEEVAAFKMICIVLKETENAMRKFSDEKL